MFTKDIRTITFIPISVIFEAAGKEFDLDPEDIASEIANAGPWSWGDSSAVLIDDFELFGPLNEALVDLGCFEEVVEKWINDTLAPAIGLVMIDISK